MRTTPRSSLQIVSAITAAGAAGWLLYLLGSPWMEALHLFGGRMPEPSETWLPGLAAALLYAAAMAWSAMRSSLEGRRLAGTLFLAMFGIHVLLVLVESLHFLNALPLFDMLVANAQETVVMAVIAAILASTLGRPPRPRREAPAPGPSFGAWGWTWRLAACSLSYVILYFTAGILIWPHIRAWYAQQEMDADFELLVLTQVVRGTLYVAFALPLLRSLVMRRWQAALAMAVAFPVLAGVAGLLIPNPLMPEFVRHWHLMEIGWSNFVYGALVGFLFWSPRAGANP